jgi:hypothetical protein
MVSYTRRKIRNPNQSCAVWNTAFLANPNIAFLRLAIGDSEFPTDSVILIYHLRGYERGRAIGGNPLRFLERDLPRNNRRAMRGKIYMVRQTGAE